jgi:hypothetical protein
MNISMTPSDIVGAIFAFLSEKKSTFPANDPLIHESIYEAISSCEECKNYLEELLFTSNEYYHYSPIIEFTMDNLQMTGFLKCNNPDLKVFEFPDKKIIDLYEKNSKRFFSKDDEEKFKNIANFVNNKLEQYRQ